MEFDNLLSMVHQELLFVVCVDTLSRANKNLVISVLPE